MVLSSCAKDLGKHLAHLQSRSLVTVWVACRALLIEKAFWQNVDVETDELWIQDIIGEKWVFNKKRLNHDAHDHLHNMIESERNDVLVAGQR